MYRRTIAVGPLSVTFQFDDPAMDVLIARDYRDFLCRRHNGMPVTILPPRAISTDDLKITARGRSILITRNDFHSRTDAAFSRSTLHIRPDTYALNSWLRIFFTLAGLRRGILLVHGAGWAHGPDAWLFAGRSGAGKSTITRLLGKNAALSDEVTMIRCDGTTAAAFSTPFWGELKQGGERSRRGTIRGICSLRQGASVSLTPEKPAATVRTLLATTLFFSNEPALLKKVLTITHAIARAAPGYTLTFPRHARRATLTRVLKEAAA